MNRPALASWASTLSFLEADIAAGMEPLARRLDLVISDDSAPVPGSLEPNGYAGITRTGPVDRLLLSEWMLASEEPDEFIRKYVSSELSFLDVERAEPRAPGRMVALVDTGPNQLGAARLAQLAALVVLMRRAAAAQVPFELGLLGSPAGTWTSGNATTVLRAWLQGRTRHIPAPNEVDEWVDTVETEASVWLLTSPTLDDAQINTDRVTPILISESAWDDSGVTELSVDVDGRLVQLALPASELCIRILRGRGLSPSLAKPTRETASHAVRLPAFPSRARQLVCRGIGDEQLQLMSISDAGDRAGKVRTKDFPGPVLAASLFGQRLVALVLIDEDVCVIVRGKSLARVDEIRVPLITLGMSDEEVRTQLDESMPSLFFSGGALLVRFADQWWRLHPDEDPRELPSLAHVGASDRNDHVPLTAYRRGNYLAVTPQSTGDILRASPVYFGAGLSQAFQREPEVWTLVAPDTAEAQVVIESGSTVAGVTMVEGEPVLVLLSPGGHLIRLAGHTIDRTLTKASRDGIADYALHPTLPYLALQREDGRIDVVDVDENRRLIYVNAQPT